MQPSSKVGAKADHHQTIVKRSARKHDDEAHGGAWTATVERGFVLIKPEGGAQ